ncbi:MAG: tripartite tricarboxylate transporter TctB family protein [Rhodospirillaceae bacterium]
MRLDVDRDLWTGVMFAAAGGLFMWGARTYTIGTPAQMGSGFFPLMVGGLMAAIGIALAARALAARAAAGGVERADLHLGPLLILIAGLCAFAVLVADGGIALALVALVMVVARAGGPLRWLETGALAIALAAFSVATFVYALGLPMRVWPAL